MSDCQHPAYALVDGELRCAGCGMPSPSPAWQETVYGAKAIDQAQTENKGRLWPAEAKRMGRRRGR